MSLVAAVAAVGQTNDLTIKPTYVKGDVASVEAGKIVVKTDKGDWTGSLSDKTAYKRVSPENPTDLKGAAEAAMADVSAGDKVLLSALANKDGSGFTVRTVYLMTKSDLSAKTQKDNEKWRNGIFGKVTAVNPSTNQLTVEVGNSPIEKTVVTLTPKADAKFMRYAPTSVKFADAKPSSIGEIVVGDRIRAIGDKSEDGKAFTATEVLSGGFRQATGKIESIDAANKQVVVKDLTTNKNITIDFANAIFLKKFPAEMATRMAGMQAGGTMGGGVRPPGGGMAPPAGGGQQVVVMGPPAGGQPNGGQPGQGGGFRAAGGNLDAMVDRMPDITAADLKAGDMIAVLTSGPIVGTQNVKALKLLAGVEPFVEIAQRQAAAAGARGAANSPNFNIPGLDGGLGLP
ncbi:MAG TPA: hypothetical protein VL501_02515 [Pyrinomonadaceae bacterium]|nr:hypothetical protein [Pyrinomonadaceae bacterium]